VRDAGRGVLRALVPGVGGDGVGRHDLHRDQAVGGDRLASPSSPVVVDAPVDDHVGTTEVQFRAVGDQWKRAKSTLGSLTLLIGHSASPMRLA
jgi:hypothetical protein